MIIGAIVSGIASLSEGFSTALAYPYATANVDADAMTMIYD